MPTCLCCNKPLTRHFRHKRLVWFCRACWQDMPVLADDGPKSAPPLEADRPRMT